MENLNIFINKFTENKVGLIPKDLKLNFTKHIDSSDLTNEEKILLLICLSHNLKFNELFQVSTEIATLMNIDLTLINEAKQIPTIMGMLNTYYKFRYFSENNSKNTEMNYGSPGLRMNSLAKPFMPKETFELLALAVSILNSCEKCVIAHEKALLDISVSLDKIHTVIKLSAIVKGLSYL